jgi:hypothetical protein
MITKNNILQWLKSPKQRHPKMSFRNSAKWFQKTSLEEVFKTEYLKDNCTIRILQEWNIFTNLKTKLFKKNFIRFSTAKIKMIRDYNLHLLTKLLKTTIKQAMMLQVVALLVMVVGLRRIRYLELDIVNLDNIKTLKMQVLINAMSIILMNKSNWHRNLKTWSKVKVKTKEQLQVFSEPIPKQRFLTTS